MLGSYDEDDAPTTFRRAAICAVAAATRACNELRRAAEAGAPVDDLLAATVTHQQRLLSLTHQLPVASHGVREAMAAMDLSLSEIAAALDEAVGRYRGRDLGLIAARVERVAESSVDVPSRPAPRTPHIARRVRGHR